MESVIKSIDSIEKGKTLVIKSTVPPGTTERVSKQYPDQTIIFNPEFLTERNFIDDFFNQDRIFLGVTPGHNEVHVKQVTDLYRDFCKNQTNPGNVFVVDSKAAEMLKYTTNCFLATKVSFFNEIYDICVAKGIEFSSVVELLKMDKRIGKSHMSVPGFENKRGWGGSCFPKDLNALVAVAEECGVDALMLEAAWVKNLTVRDDHEWEELAQVTGEYE
jgi:UDPglucose 6-dehydrogenase